MTIKLLDSLALASMAEPALIRRLAAIWCRAYKDRPPYNRTEVRKWVKAEFGPLLDTDRCEALSKSILDEVKRQSRLRLRRKKRLLQPDPLTTPAGSDARIGGLLNSRLGPARRWVSRQRLSKHQSDCFYIDAGFFSGMVAGLVSTRMQLRRIINPNLLVYRQGRREPQTRYVPFHITTVDDAFVWLIPSDAAEFLKLPGVRVEHDGEAQAVHLFTTWGMKILPWRELAPGPTD